MNKLEDYVVTIKDFPKPGIMFRDITGILDSAAGFKFCIDQLVDALCDVDFDLVIALDSRGFVFGAPVAYLLCKPLALIRKSGKLPRETIGEKYDLEYGTGEMQIHRDSVKPGQRVVVIDDLLATGGTAMAAVQLVERLGGQIAKLAFVIELAGFGAREQVFKDYEVVSLLKYPGK